MSRPVTLLLIAWLLLCPPVAADDDRHAAVGDGIESLIPELIQSVGTPEALRFPIGRTRNGTLIWCVAQPAALDYRTNSRRHLIVGGLDGSAASVDLALALFDQLSSESSEEIVYACIPIANPDVWSRRSGSAKDSSDPVGLSFPPEGSAYGNPETRESQFLWRFVGWFAPDVVEEIHDATAAEWRAFQRGDVAGDDLWPKNCLAAAVRSHAVIGIGSTFSLRTVADAGSTAAKDDWLARSLAARNESSPYRTGGHPPLKASSRSPLREEIQSRLERTPRQVAEQLAVHYGGHLDTVMYQPALALVARLRLGELTGDVSHLDAVERIVSPYRDASRPSLPSNPSGSHVSGHLVFGELFRLTGDERYLSLVRSAAELGYNESGDPREAMPSHNEMSDAVFMGCPILTAAGRGTDAEHYHELAAKHLEFMQRHCLQTDGLYRHSPLCEAAWGRGNGFPALGLAFCLTDLQEDSPEGGPAGTVQSRFLKDFRSHLRVLLHHQDVTGMWHQVIDDPGTYRELTATCMITYAIVQGLRSGWIDEREFGRSADRAWEAIKVRVGDNGQLVDVCTGTGKQKSLQDYRDRTAILGNDERGGAMAFMVAVEMARWEATRAAPEPPKMPEPVDR